MIPKKEAKEKKIICMELYLVSRIITQKWAGWSEEWGWAGWRASRSQYTDRLFPSLPRGHPQSTHSPAWQGGGHDHDCRAVWEVSQCGQLTPSSSEETVRVVERRHFERFVQKLKQIKREQTGSIRESSTHETWSGPPAAFVLIASCPLTFLQPASASIHSLPHPPLKTQVWWCLSLLSPNDKAPNSFTT